MSTSRLRCLIISIGIGLVLLFVTGTLIYLIRRHKHPVINYDSCPRPTHYETDYDFDYTKKSNEYRNTNTTIDYFRLSLSWSPTFCDGKKKFSQKLFQCQHSFGFIVHGLWPSKM
jgi:ribonuclease I